MAEQLQDNLGALDVTFRDSRIARLNTVSRIDLGFPHEFLASNMQGTMFGGVTVAMR
jgi:hypothetical protein